jgi:hypothetical protein
VDALAAAVASLDGPSSWTVPATTRSTSAGARASSSSTKRWKSGAIAMRLRVARRSIISRAPATRRRSSHARARDA